MLRIGIIGNGLSATSIIEDFVRLNNIEIVGLWNVPAINGYEIFDDVDDLIQNSEVNFVFPQELNNTSIIEKVIRNQNHLFIANPFTDNVEIAKNIMNLAVEANVKVNVGNADKLNPALTSALPHLKFPLFIESSKLEPYNAHNSKFSVELSILLNELEIILSIVKAEVKKISANGISVISNSADLASVRLEFDNGCVANLTANRISLMPSHETKLFQRDTYLNIDYSNRKTTLFELKDAKKSSLPNNMLDLGEKGKKEVIITSPEINKPVSEVEHFISAILSNSEVNNPISVCLHAIEVVKKIEDKILASSVILD